MNDIPCKIIGSHPHAGETGRIVVVDDKVKLIAPGGVGEPDMFEIKLDNCVHGASGCFARKKDVQLLKS